MHEVIVLLDDALQEIHAREEIREILCTKEHIHIGDLPVDVDIAHAPPQRLALAVEVALGDFELLLVLLDALERRIQLRAACPMLCDRCTRLLVEETFLLGERVDFARKRLALPPQLLDLGVIAVALLFERCRCALPCGKEYGGKRHRERLFQTLFHITPSGNA